MAIYFAPVEMDLWFIPLSQVARNGLGPPTGSPESFLQFRLKTLQTSRWLRLVLLLTP